MNEINITAKLFLLLGSANAMLAVMLGAFGAHALKTRLDENLLKVFHTGVEYHFYHALGLILVGIIAMNIPVNIWIKNSGWMMFAGIILFSGSLYLLSILNLRWLGMFTPLGGLLFILAWLSLCIAIVKH
ncbi:MAG TPA: DUF423 domain-containing protein [Thiotrichaceae bacterium]|jgi:uncharacterized membrane protein YgdD (TMEM256/DUF423 family)|nr:DUF423 domain-containing protein [Thiotrichaceae bacterium]HIM07008.1 DUF423 domain-containing protein [Gammaproteobacteria bacterium]